MRCLKLFLTCCIVGCISTLEIPYYIKKCSLSDPQLNDCLVEHANIAIPELVKGNELYGIPVMSPLQLLNATLEGKYLKILLTDVYVYNLGNAKLTEASYNLKNGKGNFIMDLNVVTLIGQYSISNGRILTYNISGSGICNITVVGNTIKYNSDIRLYKQENEIHQEFVNTTVNLTSNRGYYYFENIKSSKSGEVDDINSIIDQNWQAMRDETQSSIEGYLQQFIKIAASAISDKLPLKKYLSP